MSMDLIAMIECSDDLTKRIEDFLSDLYRDNKDGSEIVDDGRKLKTVVLEWLDNSFEDIKLK